MIPRRIPFLLCVLAGLLMLGGCVTPATGSDSYRDKAFTSLQAATSEVETARLALRLLRHDRILESYADETITANETALGSIGTAFGSVQPPRADDDVRDDVGGLLTDAQDAVAHARVAARRLDPNGLARAAGDLRAVADDLAKAEGRLS